MDTGSSEPANFHRLTPPNMISPNVVRVCQPAELSEDLEIVLSPSPSPPTPMLKMGAATNFDARILDINVGVPLVKLTGYPKPRTPETTPLVWFATPSCTPGTWNATSCRQHVREMKPYSGEEAGDRTYQQS